MVEKELTAEKVGRCSERKPLTNFSVIHILFREWLVSMLGPGVVLTNRSPGVIVEFSAAVRAR